MGFNSTNTDFERDEHFKYLGVTLNEDSNHQTDLQERIKKNANITYFRLQKFFRNKNIQGVTGGTDQTSGECSLC